MATTCKYEFQLKHFGFADCKQERFYVSQWSDSKLGRTLFLVYRGLAFLYTLGWIIGDVTTVSQPLYWIYLTNWSEVTGCLYFTLAFIVTSYGFVKKDNDRLDISWYHKIVWIVYATVLPAALGTDIIFWALLSGRLSPSVLAHPLNIHEHAINYVLLLLDLFLNNIPIRLLHFIHPTSYALVYTIFSIILWRTNFKVAIYPVLNWEQNAGFSALLCLLVSFVVMPVLHTVHFGLYHLRLFIARRCCHKSALQPEMDENIAMQG